MPKQLKTKISGIVVLIFFCWTFVLPAVAQENLTLTITPPLIKINMNPGESWSSTIKAVNNNSSELIVYAQTLDFQSDENGGVKFIQKDDIEGLADQDKDFLLSQWLNISEGPHAITPQSSLEVPFTINVPENAGPGGHYAAILVGTKPDEKLSGTYLKISQLLASLILVTIKGDTLEKGAIREFSTDRKFYQEPEVNFALRFQNTGNVHLQPQGEIAIYDIFGEERDRITINHASEFGNVLPKSIRKWDFSWQGEGGILNMGRYKAMLVLAYGDQARETIDQALYFWVINYKLVAISLGSILLFILFIIIFIRFYIRRAVKATQRAAGIVSPAGSGRQTAGISVIPKGNNITDEQAEVMQKTNNNITENRRLNWSFLKKLLIVLIIFLACGTGVFIFLLKDKPTEKAVEAEQGLKENITGVAIDKVKQKFDEVVVIDNSTATSSQATSTKEIIEPLNPEAGATTTKEDGGVEKIEIESERNENLDINIKILNGSGTSGLAGQVSELFRADGYTNVSTGNADAFNYRTTIIRHKPGRLNEAEALSRILDIVVEYEEVENQTEDIIIIAGKDIKI